MPLTINTCNRSSLDPLVLYQYVLEPFIRSILTVSRLSLSLSLPETITISKQQWIAFPSLFASSAELIRTLAIAKWLAQQLAFV